MSAPWGGVFLGPLAGPGTLKELSQYWLKKCIPKTLSMLVTTAIVSILILIITYVTLSWGLTLSPSPGLLRVTVRFEAAVAPAECWVPILSRPG